MLWRRNYSEPPHAYTFRIIAAERCSPTALGSVTLRGADGDEQTLWQRQLPNTPFVAWVDQQRGWVVTFGAECSVALEHAVVVYDAGGRIVSDVRLHDILTVDERRKLGHRVSGERPPGADDDDRDGRELFASAARVEFADDGVWLMHYRWERKVLLAKR